MPSSNPSAARTLKNYLYVLVSLIILSWVIIPKYYGLPYIKNAGPILTDEIIMDYQEHINETNPHIVLLGDSTLEDSISEAPVTEGLGYQTYRIGKPGSASAVWYLILKNQIATSSVKPKQLVIFSRASMLTTPDYRTTGKYEESIVELALPADSLITERAYQSQMNPLEQNLDRYFPLFGYRAYLRKSIENLVKYHAPNQILDVRPKDVENALGNVFDDQFGSRELVELNNMITMAETYLHEEERLDFYAQLPNSFLPEIVRLCEENEIQLTFVYTQTIYEDQDPKTTRLLNAYRSDLFQYAAENNIQILDYLNDERLTPDFFNDPVHMNASGKAAFTEIFAADFAKFLP